MNYHLQITAAAIKERKKLPPQTQKRVDQAITKLAQNPRPRGCSKIKGSPADWRIRIGDYRILYETDDDALVITIWRICHRKSAYR